MRTKVLITLLFAMAAAPVSAQIAPPSPLTDTRISPEATAALKKANEAAIADCEQMWDAGTHMTRQDWSRTCRRVQDRLQRSEFK